MNPHDHDHVPLQAFRPVEARQRDAATAGLMGALRQVLKVAGQGACVGFLVPIQ